MEGAALEVEVAAPEVERAARSRRALHQGFSGHEQHAELARQRVRGRRAEERHDLLLQLAHHAGEVLAGHGVARVEVHYGLF